MSEMMPSSQERRSATEIFKEAHAEVYERIVASVAKKIAADAVVKMASGEVKQSLMNPEVRSAYEATMQAEIERLMTGDSDVDGVIHKWTSNVEVDGLSKDGLATGIEMQASAIRDILLEHHAADLEKFSKSEEINSLGLVQ